MKFSICLIISKTQDQATVNPDPEMKEKVSDNVVVLPELKVKLGLNEIQSL